MENSVALVTGANKGIGKEIARQLAAAGLAVYAGSRDAARGERAVEEIGGGARLLVLDVTDAASIAAAAHQVHSLDILVNNAGISGDGKTADRDDIGTFRRIYETDVFGVVAVTNAFLPAVRRSAHPRIVNISSGTGSLARATGPQFPHRGTFAAYRSSKAALNALTIYYAHALADEGMVLVLRRSAGSALSGSVPWYDRGQARRVGGRAMAAITAPLVRQRRSPGRTGTRSVRPERSRRPGTARR